MKLKFVYSGPGANSGEFESMQIGIDDDGDGDPDDWVCPGDVQDDFPDFNEECVYEHPDSDPDTVMQVDDNNTVERDWVYSITLIPRGGCSSVTLHPPIENGGSSGSSGGDEDEDEDEGDGP